MEFEHLELRISKLYKDFFDGKKINFISGVQLFPSIADKTQATTSDILDVAQTEDKLFGLYSLINLKTQDKGPSFLSDKEALSVLNLFSEKGYPKAQFLYAHALEKQNDIPEQDKPLLMVQSYGKILKNPYALTELRHEASSAMRKWMNYLSETEKKPFVASYMKYQNKMR